MSTRVAQQRLQGRFAGSACRALRGVLGDRNLRLLTLAWAGSTTAEGTYLVVLGVFAYESGGALAVGLVGAVRMIPAAAAAAVSPALVDRCARERVLLAAEGLRTAMLCGCAVAAVAGLPASVVFGLAAGHAIASGVLRPAMKAIAPSIARTPGQLVAANAAASTTEGLGMLLGSVLGAIVVGVADARFGFAVAGAFCALAAASLFALRVETAALVTGAPRRRLGAAVAGFRSLAGARGGAGVILALFGAQTFVRGALGVLMVVIALDLPGFDPAWVGLLMAALGAGGVAGALGAAGLAGRPLARPLLLGLVLWGAPIAAIGVLPTPPVALAALAAVGAGNAILDVAGNTLLQRIVPGDALAHAFGALVAVSLATVALGSLAAPLLIETVGLRAALVITGALLPSLALLAAARIRSLDRAATPPERTLALLRGVPMLAPLSVATAEQVASRMIAIPVPAGQPIITEGDHGHRFYILADGRLTVTSAGRTLATCNPGDYAGEIALLRDTPTTATVTARRDSLVYALERADFHAAINCHPAGAPAGDAIVQQRLANHDPDTEPGPAKRMLTHSSSAPVP